MRTWHDLSGAELLARLTLRGVDATTARALVRFRERAGTAAVIDRYLGEGAR